MQDSKSWRKDWKSLKEKLPLTTQWVTDGLDDWRTDKEVTEELMDFIATEISKAREEGKKEAFTKDEWFMLKLAMNDIFNNGNTAYEEISEKIESYLN